MKKRVCYLAPAYLTSFTLRYLLHNFPSTLTLNYRWIESVLYLYYFCLQFMYLSCSLHLSPLSHRPAHYHLADKARFFGLTDKNYSEGMVKMIGTIPPYHWIIQNARNPYPCHDIWINLLSPLKANGKSKSPCTAGFPTFFFILLFRFPLL